MAGLWSGADPDEHDVVVVGEGGDRRLVPLLFLPGLPVGMAGDVVEKAVAEDQPPGHTVHAEGGQTGRPLVENRVVVVVVEASGDVRISPADDEEIALEYAVPDFARAPERRFELVVGAQEVK